MEYQVKEGFKEAVLCFQKESGVDMPAMLDDQIKIRGAIESGAIQDTGASERY